MRSFIKSVGDKMTKRQFVCGTLVLFLIVMLFLLSALSTYRSKTITAEKPAITQKAKVGEEKNKLQQGFIESNFKVYDLEVSELLDYTLKFNKIIKDVKNNIPKDLTIDKEVLLFKEKVNKDISYLTGLKINKKLNKFNEFTIEYLNSTKEFCDAIWKKKDIEKVDTLSARVDVAGKKCLKESASLMAEYMNVLTNWQAVDRKVIHKLEIIRKWTSESQESRSSMIDNIIKDLNSVEVPKDFVTVHQLNLEACKYVKKGIQALENGGYANWRQYSKRANTLIAEAAKKSNENLNEVKILYEQLENVTQSKGVVLEETAKETAKVEEKRSIPTELEFKVYGEYMLDKATKGTYSALASAFIRGRGRDLSGEEVKSIIDKVENFCHVNGAYAPLEIMELMAKFYPNAKLYR